MYLCGIDPNASFRSIVTIRISRFVLFASANSSVMVAVCSRQPLMPLIKPFCALLYIGCSLLILCISFAAPHAHMRYADDEIVRGLQLLRLCGSPFLYSKRDLDLSHNVGNCEYVSIASEMSAMTLADDEVSI